MSVIVKPVGKGGANVPTDVMVVRNLLNKFIEADISIGPLTPLPIHGPIHDTPTDPTIIAIEQFQRIFVEPYIPGFKVDGRLDPWGESIAVLSAGPRITPPPAPAERTPKEKAKALLEAFKNRRYVTGSMWQHIGRNALADGLADRVDDPYRIQQGSAGLCGPASLLFALAKDNPVAYARAGVELFETGIATIGKLRVKPDHELRSYRLPATAGIHVADWILIASIRDSQNYFFDYQAEHDMASGMTLPSTMVTWFEKAGYKVTAEECNLVFTQDEACIRRAGAAVTKGQKVSLFINSQMLHTSEQHKESRIPTHWVVLTTPVSFTVVPTDASFLISFAVFTWGRLRRVPTSGGLPLTDFLKNFYGYIACRSQGF